MWYLFFTSPVVMSSLVAKNYLASKTISKCFSCCANIGKTGTNNSAQVLTETEKVQNPVSTGSCNHSKPAAFNFTAAHTTAALQVFITIQLWFLLNFKVCDDGGHRPVRRPGTFTSACVRWHLITAKLFQKQTGGSSSGRQGGP